ncbi:anaerobic sulfatase maturase [Salmonella enterica subsp. enterica]|nr:anaerobic sulfatase maturase [Salmonella enterica subsp. enterica serovar Hvittingfoss]
MHITAKPVSYQCNLRCDYCFYLEKEAIFDHPCRMDDQTLSVYIKNYISVAGDVVYFTWQGGEPTLAGLEFFQKVITLQHKFRGSKKIYNALQTNGILLNDSWCRFLQDNDFLVGVSIDGPEELHNYYRHNRSGAGSFTKVMKAIELLQKYNVEFNTLTVVNSVNVHHPEVVYDFLKSIGSCHLQFIELLEVTKPDVCSGSDTQKAFEVLNFSVLPEDYGRFMSTIFKQWVKKDVGVIFVRQFESLISCFLGNGHTSCVFQKECKNNFILESNGDIYECDQFVYPEYHLGNIHNISLESIETRQLTAQKKNLSTDCIQCLYRSLCQGGCPKHRIHAIDGERKSYFCQGYKLFFRTVTPYMNAFTELAKHRIPLIKIMDIADQIDK